MKYIKKFEENTREFGKFYWSVDAESKRFRKKLEKINCTNTIIRRYLRNWDFYLTPDVKILFIGVVSSYHSNKWDLSKDGLDFSGYEYKGPIILSKEELTEIETEEKMDKYNL